MDTVYIETQPTSEKNVASLKAVLGNFDFMGPLRGPCLWVEMLNPNGLPFDAQYVRIDGPDWQSYPTGSYSYQWNINGTPIVGATSDTYTVSSAQESQTGVYSVAVSNNEFTITGNGYLYTSGSVCI